MADTQDEILARMLSNIPDEYDKTEGSFFYDVLKPVAVEVESEQAAQEDTDKYFAETATGEDLRKITARRGVYWKEQKKATTNVTIFGVPGTVINVDDQVSSDTLTFNSKESKMIDQDGQASVLVECEVAGTIGNVPVGAIKYFPTTISGLTSVTNPQAVTDGYDGEPDEELRQRYFDKIRNPDTGGNKNDYVRWAQEVPEVGKAKCIPRWNGNGTVKLVLAGTDYKPATQDVVDEVQENIDPKLNVLVEAENIPVTEANGITVDNSIAEDTGDSVKMVYSGAGEGALLYASGLDNTLQTENHFKAWVKLKVSDTSGTNDILKITVRDRDTQTPLKQTKDGVLDAQVTKKASQLFTDFDYVEVHFYWDGVQRPEIELRRLATDTTTTLWIDQVNFVSLYGQALGEGTAPAGARVLVKAGDDLPINIEASVVYTSGADHDAAKNSFETAVTDYLKTLVFTDGPVVYARIAGFLINTNGVSNYSNLTINGDTSDIQPGAEEVATLGTVSI